MQFRAQAIGIVYFSGFMQGIALILYPAAGPIFTNTDFHGLSSGQYGTLFIPQIVLATLASFGAPALARRFGMQQVLRAGLLANLLSMVLFSGSHFLIGNDGLPFITLLLGTAALGTGFGFTITALNPYAYSFFPGKEASAVTGLHILLGLGTALSSIVLSFFTGLGFWWGAGLATGLVLLLLFFATLPIPMPLEVKEQDGPEGNKQSVPGRVWLFFTVVFFYGACEATFGNFAPIYLEKQAGLTFGQAALGLSLFWGAIAGGRLIFTAAALRFNLRLLHVIMPLLVAGVFFFIPQLEGATANYAALIVAGLGLSFYFPYTISLATDEFPAYSAAISGILVAGIQLGTGVSSNVIGSLNNTISLGTLVPFSGVYALIMVAVAAYLFFTKQQYS